MKPFPPESLPMSHIQEQSLASLACEILALAGNIAWTDSLGTP